MKITDIKEGSPFKDLFEIKPEDLKAIQSDMSEFGFDKSHPIVIWKEKGIIIDGHTRFQAAKNLSGKTLLRTIKGEFKDLPVVELSFPSEERAIEYAIHHQTERRNLTDWDILKLVEKVDERSSNWGGVRRSNGAKASFGSPKLDSRERTADIVGISKDKVSVCRHILANCDQKTLKAIQREDKTLRQAYEQSIGMGRKQKSEMEKQEAKMALLEGLNSKVFRKGTGKKGLRKYGKINLHLNKLCLKLLPELLRKESLFENIKKEIQFFKTEGEDVFEKLSGQLFIQKFLGSPLVSDLVYILGLFGFEIKKPEGLPSFPRAIKKIKSKKSGFPRFDISKVREPGFVSHAEQREIEKHWGEIAERDLKEGRIKL